MQANSAHRLAATDPPDTASVLSAQANRASSPSSSALSLALSGGASAYAGHPSTALAAPPPPPPPTSLSTVAWIFWSWILLPVLCVLGPIIALDVLAYHFWAEREEGLPCVRFLLFSAVALFRLVCDLLGIVMGRVRGARDEVADRLDTVQRELRFNPYTDRAYLWYQETYFWLRRRLVWFVLGSIYFYLAVRFVRVKMGYGGSVWVPVERLQAHFSSVSDAEPHREAPSSRVSTWDLGDESAVVAVWDSVETISPDEKADASSATTVEDPPVVSSIQTTAASEWALGTGVSARTMWDAVATLDPPVVGPGIDNSSEPMIERPSRVYVQSHVRTRYGTQWVWCRRCQQWHCCELPY